MNWNQFKNNVEQWAAERGIYEHSTPEEQLLKALSGLGELADAVVKNDREALKDAIGDVAVCLVNYARMANLDIGWPCFDASEYISTYDIIGTLSILIGRHLERAKSDADVIFMLCSLVGIAQRADVDFLGCCAAAWNEIKDRKGRMVPGGAFVKED